MVVMQNKKGEVVPLFIDADTLMRQQYENYNQFAADWNATCERFDAVQAVIKRDEGELAKASTGDVSFAKRFVAEHGDKAKSEIDSETICALHAIAKRYEEQVHGIGELAKRSRRFASAVARRYTGPTSEVTKIESKAHP